MARIELVKAEDDGEYRRRVMEAYFGERGRALARAHDLGPPWRRLGMGWQLGLGEVEGVVLVETHDGASVRGFFMPGSAVVEVWGGDEEAVRGMVEHRRTTGIIVLVVWRPSTWWLRLKLRTAYAWRRIARGR